MAKQVIRSDSAFFDADGGVAFIEAYLERKLAGQNLDMTEIIADLTQVISAAEKISKLEYKVTTLTIPVAIDTTGLKTSPSSGCAIAEKGYFVFKSVPGDSGRPQTARLTVPCPKGQYLIQSGTKFNLNDTAVDALVDAVIANCLSSSGKDLSVVTETGVRQDD